MTFLERLLQRWRISKLRGHVRAGAGVLGLLRTPRLVDGMSLAQQFGLEPRHTASIFCGASLKLVQARRYQFGLTPFSAFVDPPEAAATEVALMSTLSALGGLAQAVVADRPAPAEFPPRVGPAEVSVVMPCLNERETLAACIEKAKRGMAAAGVLGEVVVADNGSTDGSQELATRLGARVVPVAGKGYGSALRGGIAAACGRFVIMGDSDDSYDFSNIRPFVEQLRGGAELVMGNRFRGGIDPGAMPWKHKWIGNPVLSGIGRLFFRCPVGDFHCGLRGFSKAAYERMQLQTTGMEFASEMVIKGTLMNMRIAEVPTVLHKDGRSRLSHLRSWRDGWRHLRFMLLFSPRWLFLLPGAALFLTGLLSFLLLLPGTVRIGGVSLGIHTLLVCGCVSLLGYQILVFAFFTKVFAVTEGLHPLTPRWRRLSRIKLLEGGLVAGVLIALAGVALLAAAVWHWRATGFGGLDPRVTMRQMIPAIVLIMFGAQTVFATFFLSILTLRRANAAEV